MTKGTANRNFQRILAVASGQQGLFTASQATQAGYSNQSIHYQVAAGNWIRVNRGIFQLVGFSPQPWPEIFQAALWAQNRQGVQMAVVSFQSALVVHGMLKTTPNVVFMNKSNGFKRRGALPENIVLYEDEIPEKDGGFFDGILVTTPTRTLLDVFNAGLFSPQKNAELIRNGLWNRRLDKVDIRRMNNWHSKLLLSSLECKNFRHVERICGLDEL